MSTIREDVLLQMSAVRYKKGDGTLYVMNERLAWIAENRDTVAVSHKFQDIKMQKISPEGKPKIQLQVVLHDGNSSTFHFVNREGSSAQMQDRDKIKELLQQLLPNFKRKVDKELEEKNRLLTENPSLLQLYKDLVITQVLTSEEFWASHAKEYTQNKDNASKQEIGVSGAFLADIKPQTDGCNGLKYNLTSDIIDCIFKTYPAVKRKHTDNVPSKLSESEFWTKFFQSHYFHRDRLTGGNKDIFSECGKIDDNALKIAVADNTGDPLLDLRQFEDNTLEEGFGGSSSNKNIVNSGNIIHQSMIKRFNQHSFMVLKTCTDVKTLNNGLYHDVIKTNNNNYNDIANSNIINNNNVKTNGNVTHENSISNELQAEDNIINENRKLQVKRARIMEKISYDDLGADEDPTSSSSHKRLQAQLNLTKVERYLHGPVPIVENLLDGVEKYTDLNTVNHQLIMNTESWSNRSTQKLLVSPTSAVNALGELSPGGALMRGFQEQSLAQLVPPDVEKELRFLYMALSELLKHFWTSFPPTTSQMETKASHMHEALQRFHLAKLKPFEDRAMRELSPLGASLTQHLNQLLQAANQKYMTWQDRKVRQHHHHPR